MTLHFLHVGKTGGTAFKQALKLAGKPETPYGPIKLHRHRFRLHQVPPGDYAMFCVRDPVARFVSGFNSRLNKGQPRYYFEWTPAEQTAFEAFPTPQRLAQALVSEDEDERLLAQWSMRRIRHLRFMQRTVGPPKHIRTRLDNIVYIGRQETLDGDWVQLKSLLELPADLELPTDATAAHRQGKSVDTSLDDVAVSALRDWYARDLRLVEFCEGIRAERGWGPGSPGTEPFRVPPPARKPARSPKAAKPRPQARASQASSAPTPDGVAALARDTKDRLELWAAFLKETRARQVAEIGVYRGAFAAHVLDACPDIETYYMIDPWRHLDDWNKPANRDDDAFERFYDEAMEKTREHEQRRVVLRGRTTEVIDEIPDGSLDFAYVDGDHTLRGITVDLLRVYPKLRDGGWIGGDDFARSIWQHGEKFEPTLVFPFAVYFAEATGSHIHGLPGGQFLIEKRAGEGFAFDDLTGKYGDLDLLSQLTSRPAARGAGPRKQDPPGRSSSVVRKVRDRLAR